jgi:hypothetical protein
VKAVVVRMPDGGVELRDWPSWAVKVLDEVPVLADPELSHGAAHDRLFPTATTDAAGAEEWKRNVHPELFALFASAREIVTKDLAASDRGARGKLRRLTIPREHLEGWISALQTARLHLASASGIDADAMRAPLEDLPDSRRGVVLRIDLLAELQFHIVRGYEVSAGQEGSAPGGAPPADEDDEDQGPASSP